VPISFTIEPTTGLLRTVISGRFSRDDMVGYTNQIRSHPSLDRVERRLVDVRPSALVTADELLELLVLELEFGHLKELRGLQSKFEVDQGQSSLIKVDKGAMGLSANLGHEVGERRGKG